VGIRYNYNPLNAMRRIETIFIQRRKEKDKGKASKVVVVVAGAGASMLVVAQYVLHASRKENPPQNKSPKSFLLGWLLAWSVTRGKLAPSTLLNHLPGVIVLTGEWVVLPTRLSASSCRGATHELSSTRGVEVSSGWENVRLGRAVSLL
jgi:hypothetical protein